VPIGSVATARNQRLSIPPRPGGFEGRFLVGIGAPSNDLPAANREHQPIRLYLGDDPAMPSPLALVSDQRDHLITRVDHILKLEVEVAPRRKPVPPVSPYALVPVVDAGDVVGQPSHHSRRIPFDLRVIEVERPLM